MLQRSLPAGFIAPTLPTKTDKLPSGSQWLHEIKHDGFRIIARKDGPRVRLYSSPGNDLTHRFPLIVETLARLRSRSCIIDGEAVACEWTHQLPRPVGGASTRSSRCIALFLAQPSASKQTCCLGRRWPLLHSTGCL